MSAAVQKWNGLDHLRALAILLVFFCHYRAFAHPAWIENISSFGWTGVDLFFVLSGFLISSQLFQQLRTGGQLQLKVFYIKRCFRIIPPYLAVLLLYFCWPGFREREALSPLWKFLTFTQNLALDVVHTGTFSHAWSLCIEEQFYLLLPPVLLLIWRKQLVRYMPLLLLLVLLLEMAIRQGIWYYHVVSFSGSDDYWRIWYMNIYYPTYTRLDGLITGVFISYYFNFYADKTKALMKRGNIMGCLSLVVLALSFWMCHNQTEQMASVPGFTAVALGYGLLVTSSIAPGSFLYKTTSFFTSQLAALSYSIYLTHKGIIHLTQQWVSHGHINVSGNVTLLLSAVNCVLVALLFRYLIEKPAAALKNRLLVRIANK